MEQLKIRKLVLKSALTRFKEKLNNNLENADDSEIKLFKTKMEKISLDFESVFGSIVVTCNPEELPKFIEEKEGLSDEVDELILRIDRALKVANYKSELPDELSKGNMNVSVSEVKLPKLSVPMFTGKIEDWIMFRDLFVASVSENKSISNAMKLQYLKASCKNEALQVIQSIPISDSNFELAFKLLEERYSHKRDLVNALLRRLLSQPSIDESPNQMLRLVDTTKECVRSLAILGYKSDTLSEALLVYIIVGKVDIVTRSWWERELKGDEVGNLDKLLEFLQGQARTLQNSQISKVRESKRGSNVRFTSLVAEREPCPFCKNYDHYLSRCAKFKVLTVQKRINFVKNNNVCFNCLSQSHQVRCCRSTHKCKRCSKSHNTLLHIERYEPNQSGSGARLSIKAAPFVPRENCASLNSGENPSVDNTNLVDVKNSSAQVYSGASHVRERKPQGVSVTNKEVLLCTVMVKVLDASGNWQLCRALLDPGSQASFITEDCITRLSLPRKGGKMAVSCLGATATHTNGVVTLEFTPHFESKPSFKCSAFVLGKIVGNLPHSSVDPKIQDHFKDLVLADPYFHISRSIDILLGVDVVLPVLKGESLKRGDQFPLAVRSTFGWIIAGTTELSDSSNPVVVNNIQISTDELITKFWEMEEVPNRKTCLTMEERVCESHFRDTHIREENGRYVVRLPFRTSRNKLGESKQQAMRRFNSLEKRLEVRPELYKQYQDFMKEYLLLGHMEKIPREDIYREPSEIFYLPHHAVIKSESLTTKLRVVFDASAKSSSGLSLNDVLLVGPRVQQELFHILLRFRTFPIAISADVEKMFRQVKMDAEDANYQRILWREAKEMEIEEYRLMTVTYGTSSAPFLSTRTIHQLAIDEENNFPEAAKVAQRDFYVDDLLSGASSVEEAKKLAKDLSSLLNRGGFTLRKWISNVPEVLESVSRELKDIDHSLIIKKDEAIKVLGMQWNPTSDFFEFSIFVAEQDEFTKRSILSEMAKIYDPLGFLAPCVIFMKVFLQQLWKEGSSWDEPLSEDLMKKWEVFHREISLLSKMKIPRVAVNPVQSKIEIHAFCDASEKAYCGAIYVRSISRETGVMVRLLTAKTRVAPVKTQSLPRLELCAALLLATLLKSALLHFEVPVEKIIAWTDSRIALSWITSEPGRWQTFVANRVSQIQETIPEAQWNFVCGLENPADLGTRGLLPSQLINSEQWLRGPDWLSDVSFDVTNFQIPKTSSIPEEALGEAKKIASCTAKLVQPPDFIKNISSYAKLIRVMAWIHRFVHNCRSPTEKQAGYLTSKELRDALLIIVRSIQEEEFSLERECFRKNKPLPHNSKILPLNVFLDSDGVLRVGGRLSKHSSFSYDQKHPMLLPKNHEFTKRVIDYFHKMNFHAGPQLTLSLIRQRFWFINGRSVVRAQLRKCVKCFKLNLKSSPQIMGDLPASRITQTKPFDSCAVDFAGPILTKCAHKRSVTKFKSYICLFICTATKAVHLELVSDLSTAAFLAALRRFVSRRGCPSKILSDNGSNFKGASRHLKELVEICRKSEIQDFSSMKGIEWSFIPPYTPHFGGLWESAIKSTKQLLKKTFSSALLNFEELTTLLSQIEACLNSRPLTEMSSDPSDLSALTPAHFLVGGPLLQFPEPSQPTKTTCLSERWSLLQRLRNYFWSRWSKEFLNQLQPRSKWWRVKPNLKVGELVIVQRENTSSPLEWTLGRITGLCPGADGKVRVVTVNTKHGHLKRAVNKIYLLPNNQTV